MGKKFLDVLRQLPMYVRVLCVWVHVHVYIYVCEHGWKFLCRSNCLLASLMGLFCLICPGEGYTLLYFSLYMFDKCPLPFRLCTLQIILTEQETHWPSSALWLSEYYACHCACQPKTWGFLPHLTFQFLKLECVCSDVVERTGYATVWGLPVVT